MNRNKKTLLTEIKELLHGKQPAQTLYYLDGRYILLIEPGELLDIDRDQVMHILENPKVRVIFISVDFPEPPPEKTDPTERYLWQREHQTEPVIPDEIAGRVTQSIGVADLETADEFFALSKLASWGGVGVVDRPSLYQ